MSLGNAVQQLSIGQVVLGRLLGIGRALRRAPLVPVSIIGVLLVFAAFAELIAPHGSNEIELGVRKLPPFWQDGGTASYPLGTDNLGRDIFSRIVYGARVSLEVAALTILLGGVVGVAIGLLSGYFGGMIDTFFMRIADATLAFPILLLALLLAVARGPSFENVIISLVLIIWTRFARIVRGEVLSLKQRDYVALARIAGCSPTTIMVRHLLPNVTNTIMVLISLNVGWAILVEASLGFLGAGLPPGTASWGAMINDGRQWLLTAWWISTFPGIVLALTVLAFNLFGDWMRDALDPKLRQL